MLNITMNWREKIDVVREIRWKQKIPTLNPGDVLNLTVQSSEIREKQRVQNYNGVLISIRRAGTGTRITVRRLFLGVRIEQVFIVNSATIQSIQIKRLSNVRRAKLYYLRNRQGKATNLQTRYIHTSKRFK
jgi:large subunit ribosomal protein L19